MRESPAAAESRGHFHCLPEKLLFCDDPTTAEDDLFNHAADGMAVARVWQAPHSLVIPASYRRHAQLDSARRAFADRGCPVFLRRSGGGLVPQGPGIINLSLAWPLRQSLGEAATPVYLHLCEILRDVLRAFGVDSHFQAVSGSFCDGRFNLACGADADARKIAGTAQCWRPLPADDGREGRRHIVLAHAVLLVAADLAQIHRWANGFEQLIGSDRQYDAGKTVTVAQISRPALTPDELCRRVGEALGDAVRRRTPPFLAL
ncbi:lipoate--protein ligase family protein [Affinibrenneria salicis]|uniref:Lipoate--protein ligase family protein n=1 Tax=Affinibrenneria salicis TaxID=2590031 RepID=A0A5J5FYH0_9GAMM|nr:lipoate--protein ligase family protein [Affinibrenneria salicis]KAA8999003.1 lipoate--protein ligase family protein [Affinibrenneria salicis]